MAPYSGGVMLSLDLSVAFDAVPRVHIRDSLLAARVQDSDVRIILDWLTNSTYHLQHDINLRIVTSVFAPHLDLLHMLPCIPT